MSLLVALGGGLIFVAALWLGFVVLRRMMRLFVKLAMVCIIVLLLGAGAFALWWSFSSNDMPKSKTQRTSQRPNAR